MEKTYKGFNKDLTCKGFQYEIGKEYQIDGHAVMCCNGFHACESPMEVFDYYDMLDSRFCEVEQSGEIVREKDGTKICSSKIKIVAELKLAKMIKLGIDWIIEKTKISSDDKSIENRESSAKIGSSGDSAKIGSSGYYAQIECTGEDSVICCAGHGSAVKAKTGSWITLSEWRYDKEKSRSVPVCVKTEYVDGAIIKGDTWYKLKDGEFIEVSI